MEEQENDEIIVEEENLSNESKESKLSPKMKQFLQVLKFTAFSASAGVIQLVSFSTLYD